MFANPAIPNIINVPARKLSTRHQTSSFIAIAKTTHIKQRIIKNIKNPIIITKFYNNSLHCSIKSLKFSKKASRISAVGNDKSLLTSGPFDNVISS